MKEVGAVVEGYFAALSIHQLSQRAGVEMPISRCAYEVLYEGKQVKNVVTELMTPGQKGRAAGDCTAVRTACPLNGSAGR